MTQWPWFSMSNPVPSSLVCQYIYFINTITSLLICSVWSLPQRSKPCHCGQLSTISNCFAPLGCQTFLCIWISSQCIRGCTLNGMFYNNLDSLSSLNWFVFTLLIQLIKNVALKRKRLCWLGFVILIQTWTKWQRRTLIEECIHRTILWALSWCIIDVEGSVPLWEVATLGRWSLAIK